MHPSNRINVEIYRATPAHVTIATSCWGGRCTMSFLLLAITTRRPHNQPNTTLKLHLHNVAGVVARYPQRDKTVVCVCLNANLPYSAAAMTCERATTHALRDYSHASPAIHNFAQVIRPIVRILRLCLQQRHFRNKPQSANAHAHLEQHRMELAVSSNSNPRLAAGPPT